MCPAPKVNSNKNSIFESKKPLQTPEFYIFSGIKSHLLPPHPWSTFKVHAAAQEAEEIIEVVYTIGSQPYLGLSLYLMDMLFFQLTRMIIDSFGSWALGRHIRQTLSAHVITVRLLKSAALSQVLNAYGTYSMYNLNPLLITSTTLRASKYMSDHKALLL